VRSPTLDGRSRRCRRRTWSGGRLGCRDLPAVSEMPDSLLDLPLRRRVGRISDESSYFGGSHESTKGIGSMAAVAARQATPQHRPAQSATRRIAWCPPDQSVSISPAALIGAFLDAALPRPELPEDWVDREEPWHRGRGGRTPRLRHGTTLSRSYRRDFLESDFRFTVPLTGARRGAILRGRYRRTSRYLRKTSRFFVGPTCRVTPISGVPKPASRSRRAT
jgi:hypothetical protein